MNRKQLADTLTAYVEEQIYENVCNNKRKLVLGIQSKRYNLSIETNEKDELTVTTFSRNVMDGRVLPNVEGALEEMLWGVWARVVMAHWYEFDS